jgi:hypothetical protein
MSLQKNSHVIRGSFRLLPFAALWLATAAQAQQIEQGVAIVAEKIASRVDGYAYRANSTSDIDFRGTTIAPRVSGSVRVHNASGRADITARLEHLADPATLGPFTVYVLWVITPEGRATNVGIFDVSGDRGRLETTTPLTAFALIVTAEPYFAVSVPGQHVVAQTVGTAVKGNPLEVTSLAARADYAGLVAQPRDPKHPVPVELEMARYALAVAAANGAESLAAASFGRARDAVASAEAAAAAKRPDRAAIAELANAAVQAAEDARVAAEQRRGGAELVALKRSLAAAEQATTDARTERDIARGETATSRGQTRALESRLPTGQSRLKLAASLLPRWLPTEPAENGLLARLSAEEFVHGRPELEAGSRERVGIGAGVLLGIGGLNVMVTPSLQLSEDVRILALAQQRARAVMDWLASVGVKASVGTPPPIPPGAEAALTTSPGVDLLISAGDGSETGPEVSAPEP